MKIKISVELELTCEWYTAKLAMQQELHYSKTIKWTPSHFQLTLGKFGVTQNLGCVHIWNLLSEHFFVTINS